MDPLETTEYEIQSQHTNLTNQNKNNTDSKWLPSRAI